VLVVQLLVLGRARCARAHQVPATALQQQQQQQRAQSRAHQHQSSSSNSQGTSRLGQLAVMESLRESAQE
jgi:hypothetical protein